jgi:ligand-binding sensor domain-containing protein
MLISCPIIVLGQTEKKQKPEIPQFQNQLYQNLGDNGSGAILNQYVISSVDGNNSGYWTHLLTQNTGNLPFGESSFYAFPRYWNYVFVDSQNRLFTDSGGLYVRDGSIWRKVTANGEHVSRVREIVEDDDGSFWVGTNDGLLHLNSSLQLIQEYTTSNSNLKKNDINTLWVESDGSLWVGHRWDENTGGGVTILNEQVIDSLDGYTNDIIQRSNGDIWVAQAPDNNGNFGEIYVYRPSNDSSWAYTEDNSGLPHSEVDNFSEDSQGNIWMGHYATAHHPKGGVTKFDGSNWTHFDQDDGIPQAGAWYTYAASDDKIYYSTRDSMMVYDDGSWNHFTNDNTRFPLRGVTIITENRDGDLVIGADPGADLTGGGIHTYNGTSWEFMSNHTDGGLFSNIIFGADVDTAGNVWVSGFYGAAKYDGQNWTYFSENDGMSDTYAWKILAASNGDVWLTTVEGSPTLYSDGTFTTFEDDPAFSKSPFVEAAFEDSQGNIWFAAFDSAGVVKYDGTNFTNYSSENSGVLAAQFYTAFGEGPNGDIYVASPAGVSRFDVSSESWSEFAVDGQTGTHVNELASDHNNNLYFDIGGTIKKWDGSTWTTYDISDGYMGWTTHIEPAQDGSIWMAGAQIQVIRDGNIYDLTPATEYGSTISYVITHDDQGQTWVGTYGNGIFKHEMSEGLTIESVTDYPDDQGGWVTVTPGGFLMDPIPGGESTDAASWAVQRLNGDHWETAGTSFEFSETGNQMSVQVPTTMPTGEELDEYKYDFRVAVYDNSNQPIAYSSTVSGYAIDNIPPEVVGGVNASRGSSNVTLSWNANSANDIQSYEVVSAENPNGEPLVSTLSNSVMLSDANFNGIQNVHVRARDENKNTGELSDPVRAVFPLDLTYEVEDRWNLIGLPLDATEQEISSLLSQVEDGSLYEFAGKYQDAETLEPGKGYWAKFDGSSNYDVTGLPLVDKTLDLREGWNLISGVGQSLNFDDIQDPDDILIEGTLSGFEGTYSNSSALNPGAGYWVRTSQAGTVTLSLDAAATTKDKETKSLLAETKEGLNKVILHSSDKYQRTLYFGKELPDGVNSLSFSLPPVPPGNSFDARFAGDMNYSRKNAFEINLQKDKSAKVTIELELPEASEYQEYVVQEYKGDQVVAEYEINGQNSVTLKNNDITGIKMKPAGMQELGNNIPDKFSLDPSYPNPFNPSTTIQYQLPEQTAVNLEVFNMVGQKVSTLVPGEQQEAGTHKIRFDASSLSSGIYFVRLQAGTFRQIQKITLIK